MNNKNKMTIKEILDTRQALEKSIVNLINHYESITPMVVKSIEMIEQDGETIVYVEDSLINNSDVYIKDE